MLALRVWRALIFIVIVTKSKLMFDSAWQCILLFLCSLFTRPGRFYWRIKSINTATFVAFRSTVHHYDAVDVLCLIADSCTTAAGDASLRT